MRSTAARPPRRLRRVASVCCLTLAAGSATVLAAPSGVASERFVAGPIGVDSLRQAERGRVTVVEPPAPPTTTPTTSPTTTPTSPPNTSPTTSPTTTPNTTPNTSPTTPPPTTPPPTTAPPSVPAFCAAGGSALWAALESCGWPGSTNTGVPAGVSLRATNGRTITVDNTVIDGEAISGSLTIDAANVTIRNSRVSYSGSGGGGSGGIKILNGASATIDRVEIDGNSAVHTCVWHEGAQVTVNAVNCHDIEDGMFAWSGNGPAGSGDRFTITNSYIHGFNAVESNGHFDGFQTEGAADGLLRHNTFDLPTDATGAISIWNSHKNTRDITAENNLIRGGGFSVYAQDYSPSESAPAGGFSMTNVRFVNNVFSNASSACVGDFGVWFFRSAWTYQGGPTGGWGANGNQRTGNRIIETSRVLDSGNPPGCT
jgi:hypothetical protein